MQTSKRNSAFRCLGLLVLLPGILFSQANPPRIFYSDIDSGPNSGGENNLGAFVTIYGSGFGASQGASTVTVGGGAVAAYKVWTDTKVSVQLGAAAATGNIVLKTSAGSSNGVPFTVRPGNIYFVSISGNDTAAGSATAPWKSILKARDSIVAGDIIYVRNGVAQITDDGEGWNSCFTIGSKTGTAGKPMAIVVYPGESATIGSTTGCGSGIRSKGQGENYWTVAGFNLRGIDEAITTYGSTNWRVIGNDMTCPNGNGASACFETSLSTYLKAYGNNVHDTGVTNASSLYHGVYFSTDSNHIDFGWNTIANVRGCRGLQVHSSPLTGGGSSDPTGHDQYDLKIHDNVIHDTQCDGIILATVDPSQGSVEVYNNLIYNAGKGPNNPESSGAWTCINVQGWTNSGPAGSGTIEVYSNTMYACGTFANPPYLGGNAGVFMVGPNANKKLRLRNNLIYLTTNIPYVSAEDGNGYTCTSCPRVTGSNNLFFGSTQQPSSTYLTSTLTSNPLLVAPSAGDFHLLSGSPAADGGIAVGLATDIEGKLLPQGPGYPIGAYDFGSGSSTVPVTQILVSPGSSSLVSGQSQAFSASVTGTQNTAVTWSLNPNVGSISSTGVYTAPNPITAAQTVQVTATLTSDPTKSSSATVNLTPVAISISGGGTIAPGQSTQFNATISGATNTAVTWSISPAIGAISASGLYTAPSSSTSAQTITVTATSVADATKKASGSVTVSATQTVSISLSPTVATVNPGSTRQFTATVSGSTNTAVNWTLSPAVGTISSTGLYTAPSSVSVAQTVTLRAVSQADATKTGTAIISLTVGSVQSTPPPTSTGSTPPPTTTPTPPPTPTPTPVVSLSVAPSLMTLNPGMTSQFTATVSGTTDTAVTWSISPSVGTISATGLYTAPGSVSSQQIITIRATSAADSTKSATAVVTVNPPPTTGLGLSVVSLGGTRVRVSFTAPAGRPANDWIGLSSPGAPYWWTIWNSQTNGKTSGYFDVTLPTTAGIYEFRYYSGGTFNIAVTGAPITSGTTGYAVTPTSSSFTSAQYVTYSYNAPKAVAGDCVALVPVGQPTEKMIWFVSTNGAKSGTGTGSRQAPPGTYELRYITQGGYVSVAISSPIQIR